MGQAGPLLSRRRGGCAIKKKLRSNLSSRRRGGVAQEFLDHTTPSAPSEEASRRFLDVASTPPPAEEGTRLEPEPRLGVLPIMAGSRHRPASQASAAAARLPMRPSYGKPA